MEVKKTTNILIAVTCGIALGAGTLWFLQFAWERVQEHDANPRLANVKNQLMRRKAMAMDDALHATIRGNLSQVNAAAVTMKQSKSTIDGFLATEVYSKYGDDFDSSIEDLLAATDAMIRKARRRQSYGSKNLVSSVIF